jgi:predicted AlkP superfamily phosphohydrolase/phosphomutase
MRKRRKVLIIGLDGFTWDLGRRFIHNDVMPNLGHLAQTGSQGNLQSVIPYETCPAWTAFQTGCSPGKTGVFTFFNYNRQTKKIGLNNYSYIAVPTLWDLLSRAKKRLVSINMPVTSHPPEVNGIIVPGLLCPELSADTVYPSEVYEKYLASRKDYRIVDMSPADTLEEFVQHQVATETARGEVALEIMQDTQWDVFSIQMQSTDHLQHVLWWALDSESPDFCPESHEEAMRLYRCCDESIGRLVEAAGEDTLVFVVSDHGFCGVKHSFLPNIWLRKKGYLSLYPEKPQNQWGRMKSAFPPLKFLARSGGEVVRSIKRLKKDRRLYCERDLVFLDQHVDVESSSAIAFGGLGGVLYLNGDVAQRKTLAQRIKAEIIADLGPASPVPVVAEVLTGREQYGCELNEDRLPDLILRLCDGVYTTPFPLGDEPVVANKLSQTSFYTEKQGGTHTQDGILVVQGPGVRSGQSINGHLVDIMPSILAYLGLPIPKHVDGKLLEDAFFDPPEIEYEDYDFKNSSQRNYSKEEQETVEKHLADLGYL